MTSLLAEIVSSRTKEYHEENSEEDYEHSIRYLRPQVSSRSGQMEEAKVKRDENL